MSQIYFLGREDAEGLARVQNRGVLTYDAEVGGWDRLTANDEMYSPEIRREILLCHRVFDSRTVTHEEPSKNPEEAWPTITYQVRFGNDQ